MTSSPFSSARDEERRLREEFLVLDQMSLAERLRQSDLSEEENDLAGAFWTACSNGSSETGAATMPLRWFARTGHDFGLLNDMILSYELVGGMRGRYERIAADVRGAIQLGTQVDTITAGEDGASLRTLDGATCRPTP